MHGEKSTHLANRCKSSVGSVGTRSDNTVSAVTFESSEVKASQNGIRIKTISGATGSVSGVTYKSILLSGITEYGITVRQGKQFSLPIPIPIPIPSSFLIPLPLLSLFFPYLYPFPSPHPSLLFPTTFPNFLAP